MAAITPSGPGLFLLLVSTILLSLSAITVGLRMYVRGTHKTTGMDDWLMVAGLVSLVRLLLFSRPIRANQRLSDLGILPRGLSSNDFSSLQWRRL